MIYLYGEAFLFGDFDLFKEFFLLLFYDEFFLFGILGSLIFNVLTIALVFGTTAF